MSRYIYSSSPFYFNHLIFFLQMQVYSKQDPYNHPIVVDVVRNLWFSAKGKCDAWAVKNMLDQGMVAGETIALIFTCVSSIVFVTILYSNGLIIQVENSLRCFVMGSELAIPFSEENCGVM